MDNQELQYAGCHFDVVFTAYSLAYMQSESIPQTEALQIIAKSLPMFFNSYSGKDHFLLSNKSDLGITCKCSYTKGKIFTININFVFRLSSEDLFFSYNDQKVHLFYAPGHFASFPGGTQPQRPRKESSLFKKYKKKKKYPRVVCEASIKMDTKPRKCIPADGFVTVLSFLDKLIGKKDNDDLILTDIITLALSHYMLDDVLQLEIIAAPIAVHRI
ncbi:hypothetical protein [Selenomonas ruminantium]|uniref:Uncharacterized protein n=1 Tax=Selenomonas ruminantium TaxID=971 RepID=A0A1H0NKR9_SELRU|nr:hypothetical protein [Selenomonas ruminantium]SDO93284.1 hypothetical protein SAMN05216366_103115 [Selenomonas ruminantium]